MKSEIEYYEKLEKKLEREISDLWEVNKKSKAKERKLHEVELILIGLTAEKTLEEERRKRQYYEDLLKRNNISYLR